ncbi:hypothetical protein [Streptomyces sp. NPDC012888]|uniref:hypothetical protein n=1 Tax=Streptomyces sp. NPDC012888 TaxID=3364855 RepID=UPI003699C8A9
MPPRLGRRGAVLAWTLLFAAVPAAVARAGPVGTADGPGDVALAIGTTTAAAAATGLWLRARYRRDRDDDEGPGDGTP